MRSRTRSLAVVAAAAVVASSGLAACGEPTYSFVSNGQENAYFKVPRDWQVYRLPNQRSDRLEPPQPEDVESIWQVGFDSADDANEDNLGAITNWTEVQVDDPVGQVAIYQVQGGFNQQLSLTTARSAVLGFDPLYVGDEVQDLVEVIRFEPVEPATGLQGSRVVFNVRPRADAPWRTYDLTTMIDQGRFRLYTFTVGCSASCFKDNERQISEIVSSWKVEP
jgi:hypothetical protein